MNKTQLSILLALTGVANGMAQMTTHHFALQGPGGMGTMSGGGFDPKTVEGLPYTADAVTETTQSLADGTRIVNKQTGAVARDSKGRTRREETIAPPGSSNSAVSETVAWINDPVAKATYLLTASDHVAHKMPWMGTSMPVGGATMSFGVVGLGTAGVPAIGAQIRPIGESKEEKLGSQIVEGLQAVGVRSKMTIQAGEMGNDRPIEVTEERWSSSELGILLMSKRIDPMFGESVYRLANIRRTEPAASNFEVPADYQVEEGGPMAGSTVSVK